MRDTIWFDGARLNFAENILSSMSEAPDVLISSVEEKDLPLEGRNYSNSRNKLSAWEQHKKGDRVAVGKKQKPSSVLLTTDIGEYVVMLTDFGERHGTGWTN